MSAAEKSTFWLLYGQYGPVMDLDAFRREFLPKLSLKAVQNRVARGDVPRPINGVLDVRDVADWWDGQRKAG
jgi:hypothetical protein